MKNINTQKGQAILFVVVAMTVALAIGVAVSTRTISSQQRTTGSDTASRVFAAAEGCIEEYLKQPMTVLQNLADGDNNNGNECPQGPEWSNFDTTNTKCLMTFSPVDNITSTAVSLVTSFTQDAIDERTSENYLSGEISAGSVKEVRLSTLQSDGATYLYYPGNLDVCWSSTDSSSESALYYSLYNSNGYARKRIILPSSGAIVGGALQGTVDATPNTTRTGFNDCYTIESTEIGSSHGLRIKSLYNGSKIGIFASGTLPVQGYKIECVGQLQSVEDVTTSKTITVYKSLPYAAGVFDYALYGESSLGKQ